MSSSVGTGNPHLSSSTAFGSSSFGFRSVDVLEDEERDDTRSSSSTSPFFFFFLFSFGCFLKSLPAVDFLPNPPAAKATKKRCGRGDVFVLVLVRSADAAAATMTEEETSQKNIAKSSSGKKESSTEHEVVMKSAEDLFPTASSSLRRRRHCRCRRCRPPCRTVVEKE